jgi:hypothetical protein
MISQYFTQRSVAANVATVLVVAALVLCYDERRVDGLREAVVASCMNRSSACVRLLRSATVKRPLLAEVFGN